MPPRAEVYDGDSGTSWMGLAGTGLAVRVWHQMAAAGRRRSRSKGYAGPTLITYAHRMPLHLSEQLPHDRPRERFWAVGPAALTGQELLAILLGTGTAGRDALAVAGEVLSRVEGPLRRPAARPWAELAHVPGVG